MLTTKILTTGLCQVVLIPEEYRIDTDEVFISKIGDTILLTPIYTLARKFDLGASMLTDDFLSKGSPT